VRILIMTDKQLEANRRNALQSTGPTTPEGVEGCKMNAVRHGLRALQTVVPGENADDWEAHRDAIEADLDPHGAVEAALAEQVAVKLWRLGRVVRHEADLIANGQAQDEILRSHEKTYERHAIFGGLRRTDVPMRKDVADAKEAADLAAKKLPARVEALGQLQALATMHDEDALPDWTLFEVLRDDLRTSEDTIEQIFRGEDNQSPFLARHARQMIANRMGEGDDIEELRAALTVAWDKKLQQLEKDASRLESIHKNLARRYKAALERNRRARGLPGPDDLDRIQRYEAHLERGLHKALDRLHDLQAARGAVPPRAPSVAVAVVHTRPETPPADQMGPFGSFALEAEDGDQEATEGDAQG
jgi:hypothetical protein